MIRSARRGDVAGLLGLAAQVEPWFGPMVGEPGFHRALDRHVHRGTALVAVDPAPPGGLPFGALLFGVATPRYHVRWLVVSEHHRGRGVGRALLADALRRFATAPGTVEVVTFGPDHPAAVTSGARAFYTRLGFTPGEHAGPGPEGGSRQVYRRPWDGTPLPS